MKRILLLLMLALWPACLLAQSAPKLILEPLIEGLQKPLFLTHDPTGRLHLVEQGGLIHALDGAGRTLFLDLRDYITDRGNEQGLLGLAFHPRYPERNEVFVFYTARGDGANTLARVVPNPNAPREARPPGLEVMLSIESPAANHNGGMIAFGPDGMLYIATGDGGGAGDPWGNAQNLASPLGKLLRIDPDAARPYAIPDDNPYANHPAARGEIWAFGLRNPWRFSFDRMTGDLWIGDVGQNRFEEINRLPAGSRGWNFGWNRMEGNECFPPRSRCTPGRHKPPVAAYGHDQGCSVTGGYIYRGRRIPQLAGTYLFADYCSGRVWGLRPHEGAFEMRELLQTGLRISSFGEDAAGELYVIDHQGGRVFRIAPRDG